MINVISRGANTSEMRCENILKTESKSLKSGLKFLKSNSKFLPGILVISVIPTNRPEISGTRLEIREIRRKIPIVCPARVNNNKITMQFIEILM